MKISAKLIAKIVGIIAAIAVVVGLVVYFVPVFRVTNVEVTGNSHVTPEQVEEAAGVPDGSNLLRINVHDTAANVASLPWVATATVGRSLPNTLVVELTEREVAAYVDAEDGPHLIDTNGREFIIDTPPEEAVEITGDWDSETLSEPVDVIAAIPEELRTQIARIDVEERYVMSIHMEDGRTVMWGASEDNENKARALETVLQMEGDNWNISNPSLVSRP
ncbi:cell division protein FtsQ/DivIB [Corynebacterium sp. L4756]|uniref:cell division protein FtsQ/DivIB n=1 Tax=unclassified Corynebacterium TaxID=2624378 RepID=UPI00374D998C